MRVQINGEGTFVNVAPKRTPALPWGRARIRRCPQSHQGGEPAHSLMSNDGKQVGGEEADLPQIRRRYASGLVMAEYR